jgi:hypothetical protein
MKLDYHGINPGTRASIKEFRTPLFILVSFLILAVTLGILLWLP